MVRNRLGAMSASGTTAVLENNLLFFQEALVYWEMLLAFVMDGNTLLRVDEIIAPRSMRPLRSVPHPWTGIARDIIRAVQRVGRLVRAQRIKAGKPSFTTQAHIRELQRALEEATELEQELLVIQHLDEHEILSPNDAATPVWHLTTIAEVYRLVGLLQLYRVFPDLLTSRLVVERRSSQQAQGGWLSGLDAPMWHEEVPCEHEVLLKLALEALSLLERIPLTSGTRDFQPFLLVACSSELVAHGSGASQEGDIAVPMAFMEVVSKRKLILDRLTSFLRILPPTPMRVCIDIAKESWWKIDAGEQNVYWMDVMMMNEWETTLA